MASAPRIVAELGRPETPDETAARKAESSRVYRSSQTARNLIAAILATLVVVAVVVFAVPHGEAPPRASVDVKGIAQELESGLGRTLVVPTVPADWTVNGAAIEGDAVEAWTIVYVPDEDAGFLRVAQGLDADPAWPARVLHGASVHDTVTIDGIEWDRYRIADPTQAGNVSAALSTQAGADMFLIYGSASDDALKTAAAGVADGIRTLQEDVP